MHFHKHLHPANFEFPAKINPAKPFATRKGQYLLQVEASPEDIYHLQVIGGSWAGSESEVKLSLPTTCAGLEGTKSRLTFAKDGTLCLEGKDGETYLTSSPGRCFGQCGEASMFEFTRNEGDQFYGMGEKWTGFEHSGKTTKFWNTDVVADFHYESYVNGKPAADPVYVSVPYLILKRKNTFTGLLLDNPYATFISTGQRRVSIASQMSLKLGKGAIHLGAEQGQPNLYLLVGPSLAELTRKLQKLVGVTPLPPAWALGYHQCRWGYQSEADLLSLDKSFRQHEIPADGLWLDIDYMDHYKVFTFNSRHFPRPASGLKKLNEAGRKIVSIIDPGVTREAGYGVYDRGRREKAFCLNPQGEDYIGLVWPGITVFPDFSLPSARAWWAGEVEAFARLGFYGAWLDMNDPATGPVDNQDMLFQEGRKSHSFYHNQYALGMAIASRQGFQQAHPDQRPFLLSRSGFTGSSRSTAIWTGDNFSNYHHLKNSIATTLNLALSGIPFNGADVGGFGADTHPALLTDWMKAAFLFPFFRNHTSRGTRRQEPWAFGPRVLSILRQYIRLRYRLRPYLYQLFVEQERSGEAILRPLFYDFADTARLPLGLVDDQFMIGPSLMQAPFVEEKQAAREVVLPKGSWYAPLEAKWLKGGRKIKVRAEAATTPLYVRDGSILPLARLAPKESAFRGDHVDFHFFLEKKREASCRYVFDDGATLAYQTGKRSEIEIAGLRKGSTLAVTITSLSDGFGPGEWTFTTSAEITAVTVNQVPAKICGRQGIPFGPGKVKTWAASPRP
jgi:alpha-glucosidase